MTMTRTHLDRALGAQLKELREALLAMMTHVETMVWSSVLALTTRDRPLAARVIQSDNFVDDAELRVDEACLGIIARFQPLASDLRLVTLAMKMVTDLERMGDVAVNICERALEVGDEPLLVGTDDLLNMGGTVRDMIREARAAFAANDVDLATTVIWRDDDVDRLYLRVFANVLARMQENATHVRRGLPLLGAAKALERIADHTVNLAEGVIYLVKGQDVRHLAHPSMPPHGVG
jgi:phosphate transport system protein